MNYKNYFILIVALFLYIKAYAQTQSIAYSSVGKGVATTFVTDYHCLGINSSALGWGTGYERKKITTGSSEFSLGIYSDNLSSDNLKKLYRSVKDNVLKKSISSSGKSRVDSTKIRNCVKA